MMTGLSPSLSSLRLLGVALLLSSGPLGASTPADSDLFENKIRPVLIEKCYSCHSAAKQKGGLRLDSRESILKGGASGTAAIPGNPDRSLLIRAIRRIEDELKMPPGDAPLAPEQIQAFAAWVKMGLPFPGSATTDPKAALDLAQARRFWSFQPLKEISLPRVKQADWPAGPIDQFVLARLEEKGMKPSPTSDKRSLLRRVTYDLTGLPPAPEEVDAFLRDTSTEAYARVIDRLLISPQYGVKWGRHWLDVARYGDTRWVGAGEDRRWPFAFTYRDWVIHAFNDDMPYDRFVTLQLAADQTPGVTAADQAALGFLTVGRWFTGNLHDVIDDQIDVVTRGFLGLTVQCARCHDHKFDPISARDYYSLYGLFAASRLPVEGTGMLAELPEVTARPVDPATENEVIRLRQEQEQFLATRLQAVRGEFRQQAKIEQYMLAAESVVKKTDKDVRELAKARELNETILFRWVRYLQRTVKSPHPIFGPWHTFAAVPEAELSARAKALAEQETAGKKLNRHVAAILAPAPASLEELARSYAKLFLKLDGAEQAADADDEAIRQVLRNNDSPVQVGLGELGQLLSREDQDQLFRMRRSLLAKQNELPKMADRYLLAQSELVGVMAEVKEFLDRRKATVVAEARSAAKIADYLMAARDAQGADDFKFRSIVNSRKLSDRLLRRWVEFLQRSAERDDPVFAAWRAFSAIPEAEFARSAGAVSSQVRQAPRHRMVAQAFVAEPRSLREVATRYGELIAKLAGSLLAPDKEAESLRQVSAAGDSPLAFGADEALDYFTRKDLDELRNQENKLARIYLEQTGAAPRAMVLQESPRGYSQKVFVRGNPNVPGEDGHGGFLSVLSDEKRPPFRKGKGRWDLAQAIVDPTNPLAARVMVNRVWQWHFGAPLIRTPSDLGTRGESPSHPELLDWLARRFVANGWSIKQLHRDIMLSATYRQSSQDNPACRAIDPDNRLLWRMSHRRLSFEELRDSLLVAGGELDWTTRGRPVDLTGAGARCRTVFGVVDRVNLPGFYRYFDFPSADAHVPTRHETIIPQQALFMMNSSFFLDQAARLSRRTEIPGQSPADRINALYRLAYGRAPGAEELALGLEFISSAPPPTPAGPESPRRDSAVDAEEDPWRYGHGHFGEKEGRVLKFESFPYFNGQWRGGAQEVDPRLGRCSLHSQGGTTGGAGAPAVIRRWVAPRDGKVSITCTLASQAKSIQPQGDGHRGRIVSSRGGQLGHWLVHGTEEAIEISGVEVRRGDTIDFVVEGRGRDQNGGFNWAPVIRMEGGKETSAPKKDAPKGPRVVWEAAKDFKGKPTQNVADQAGVWERYAQVLLEANEFLFLD